MEQSGNVNSKRLVVAAVAALVLTVLVLPAAGRTGQVHAVNVSFTNTTGQAASHFVLIASITTVPGSVVTQPAGCGTPQSFGGFEYIELIWPTACIGPGEGITLDTVDPGCCIVYADSFAPSPPVISAVNNKGFAADELAIDTTSTGLAGAVLIQNAPGCPQPTLDEQPPLQLTVVWSSDCIDPGEKVAIHVAGPGAGGFNITSLPFQFSATSDFGDAPDNSLDGGIEAYPGVPGRFPSLFTTANASVPGNTGPRHLTVNEEWLGNLTLSTTTESDANLVDNDEDDVSVTLSCPAGFPARGAAVCFLQIESIAVGAAAPAGARYVNALVDVNRNGRWESATPFGTFPREHAIVNAPILVPPGEVRTLLSAPIIFGGDLQSLPVLPDAWVRVTVTREPINLADSDGDGIPDEGWDGSAPPGGFAFGETEDHLLTTDTTTKIKEPRSHFEIEVVPAVVPMDGSPPSAGFTVRVSRRESCKDTGQMPGPSDGSFICVTNVTFTLDSCVTAGPDGIDIDGVRGPDPALRPVGQIRNDLNVPAGGGGIVSANVPIGAQRSGRPTPAAPAEATYRAFYESVDARVTRCNVSFAVDPAGTIVEYDGPFNVERPIHFLEPSVEDDDVDGVPDELLDQCLDLNDPLRQEDLDGYLDDDGCQDPDNDGDQVLDANDICPLDKEDLDGFADDDGCPDPSAVGGISVDPNVGSLPLETPDSPGEKTGPPAGIVAAVAFGTVVLGGAAWYARRRGTS